MFVSHQGEQYGSASILAKGKYNNDTYYYFPVHKNTGKVMFFGGLADKKDHSHPSVTASREMFEESNGVFGSQNHIQNRLNTAKKVHRIYNKQKKHIAYVVPFKVQGNPSKKFKKSGFNNEIGKIIAVKKQTLQAAIATNNWNFQGHEIRHCEQDTLKKLAKKGFI